MGKYSKLRAILPAFQQEETYQAKVEEQKQFILANAENPGEANVTRLAALFALEVETKRLTEERIYEINLRMEAYSQLLVAALEDSDMQKVELVGGTTVSIKDTPYTSVEDRAKIFAWIKKNKLADLLSVNYQTLNGMNNERLVSGQAVIPGTKVFIKTRAAVRNGRALE